MRRGFTLVELLVVIAIVGLLATISAVALGTTIRKGRDAKRKADVVQIGRLLASGRCFIPTAGAGDYDVADVAGEVAAANPQMSQFIAVLPKDPRGGTAVVTKYRYVVTADGETCAVYANLENENEPIVITGADFPEPGLGNGVGEGTVEGVNNTRVYFQASNR